MVNKQQIQKTLRELVKLLDIPPSYYEKAVARYQSMADHLRREQSTIREFDPMVHPQGSFRLGTVIRPLSSDEGYDLDLVCKVHKSKDGLSQKELKELIGEEVKSYSSEQGFNESPEDKRRCWTQQYQDDVDFHMDILPSVPAGNDFRRVLLEAKVDERLVDEAINITDKEEPNYEQISPFWPRSNPRGFALWFEQQMDIGGYATSSRQVIFESKRLAYGSADEVPAYALKTPLQRVVQLLKRHRDEMFKDDAGGKPISIIITTLAARAYQGESDVADAMAGVLDRMDSFVSSSKPRIPNPVDPTGEDFADRWDTQLETNFWRWLRQAREDFAFLGRASGIVELTEACKSGFGLDLSDEAARASICSMVVAPSIVTATKVSSSAPSSWGE